RFARQLELVLYSCRITARGGNRRGRGEYIQLGRLNAHMLVAPHRLVGNVRYACFTRRAEREKLKRRHAVRRRQMLQAKKDEARMFLESERCLRAMLELHLQFVADTSHARRALVTRRMLELKRCPTMRRQRSSVLKRKRRNAAIIER